MNAQVGRIVSIAGPVVRCTGLPAVRMYEVVRVGHSKLIGEVIEVGDTEFTAQVYEETSGVAPGEPVVATGDALSVELGPGLLGSIYDGIQRPLSELRSLSGDFISRGLTVEGLNKEKKWHFRPTVKVGTTVVAGDIIGEVPETGLITSKIMIPVGVEGRIEEISPEGEYRVIDTVCKVRDPNGTVHNVIMMQRTPVRTGRPFRERVEMDTPLITGQRVIDTFMPQAKGGTGAIPGGFGTGKCVPGETPVLLADGSIVPIEELYRTHLSSGVIIEDNATEQLILLKLPLNVLSFDGTGYSSCMATHIYRGMTSRLVRVKTQSGRVVTVTPVHRLFKFNSGTIEEIEAQHLKVGDLLAVPRRLSFGGVDVQFDAYDLFLDYRTVDKSAIDWVIDTVHKLNTRMTLKEIADALDVSIDVLVKYVSGSNSPTLRFIDRLAKLAETDRVRIHTVMHDGATQLFRVPSSVTPELAEWLGLFIANGTVHRETADIYLYNTSTQILDRFVELTRSLFGLETESVQQYSEPCRHVIIRSSALADFLYYLGVPRDEMVCHVRIPVCIMRSQLNNAVHFLAGFFAGDGTISHDSVVLSTTSKAMYIDLSYLLTRLGIMYTSRVRSGTWAIELDMANTLQMINLFLEHDVFEYEQVNELYRYSSSSNLPSSELIMPTSQRMLTLVCQHATMYGGHDAIGHSDHTHPVTDSPTIGAPQMVHSGSRHVLDIHHESQDALLCSPVEMGGDVYLDPIVQIESFEETRPVYDLTVEGSHNFVGGDNPFTLHNTVTLHQFAKWADAQVIVYVGCGERGNEMTEALEEWPKLKDPKSGRPLMERTVLIANTSNMPVAAREASIYVAVTIAEYFRDQGYDVALMADSTSRWAEALREISGRLGQLPSEEGYPAYLGSRLAQFYERGGRMRVLGSDERFGSVTICGAVSPPGGDFSEPVTQATLRIVKVFWALDKDLAARRFFPAINPLTSYSLYESTLERWHRTNLGPDWPELVRSAMAILQKDQELREIVQLVGPDALPESERAILEAARMIREDFLTQSALHEVDTYCPPQKTYRMLKVIMTFVNKMIEAVKQGAQVRRILEFSVLDNIARMKIAPWDSYGKTIDTIERKMEKEFENLMQELAEHHASSVTTTN